LKIALDVSAVTSTTNIGGINQPVIGQRKIEHDIRLREGEVNLLGGILEDQTTKSLSGIPGLAQIPILKYLFSQSNTEHRENEIVFALIPHIVRGVDISDLNRRALDVGTASAIELHRASRTMPAGQAPATAAPGVPQQPLPNPQSAPPQQNPQQGGNPGQASFIFDPASVTQKPGSTFTVNILLSGAQNVSAVPLQMSYDPRLLQLVNVSNGGFLSQDGQAVALVHRDDDQSGTVQINANRPPGSAGVSGQGAVVTLTFIAKAAGQTALTIARGGARDPNNQALPVSGAVANVVIQ